MEFLKPNGFVYNIITRFSHLVLLSLCWLICCIPIITIGAATAAMYAVCFKLIQEDDAHIVKKFFRYFKSNFKQATLSWLIMLILGAAITYMIYLYMFGMSSVSGISDYLAMVVIISAAVLFTTPVISHDSNTFASIEISISKPQQISSDHCLLGTSSSCIPLASDTSVANSPVFYIWGFFFNDPSETNKKFPDFFIRKSSVVGKPSSRAFMIDSELHSAVGLKFFCYLP